MESPRPPAGSGRWSSAHAYRAMVDKRVDALAMAPWGLSAGASSHITAMAARSAPRCARDVITQVRVDDRHALPACRRPLACTTTNPPK